MTMTATLHRIAPAPAPAAQTALDQLAYELEQRKAEEKVATDRRVQAEQAIAELLAAHLPEEGTFAAHGTYYAVKVTTKLSRTIDKAKLADVVGLVPEAIFHRLFEYEPKLNLKELRYVHQNEPHFYAVVAQAITTKPAKTVVAVERVAE